MTEEEYFRKHYPDFCYGDRLLSPYWDLFQYGVEFGERQSEKKIEELEKKLEQTEKDLADYQFNYPKIKELEKENTELKDDNKVMADNYSKMEQKFYDNLTKAKEILRSLYFIIQSRIDYKNNIEIADEMWRAEQFLKEIEK